MTDWLTQYKKAFEYQLAQSIPNTSSQLHQAMRYSTLQGGKRVRPLLVYALGLSLEANPLHLHTPAIAIELIHNYSLIHDDLPSMDNDDLRRGKLTCHKAFDESTAILAGDALQTLAFDMLSRPSDLPNQLSMLQTLAHASGCLGMAEGQSLDMLATDKIFSLALLQKIHLLKTGALFRASVCLGALAANADTDTLKKLDDFALLLGLTFQIHDDIIDVETDKGAAQPKATYCTLLGLEETKALYQENVCRLHDTVHQLSLANTFLTAFLRGFF